jgi:protein-disulfide isomerase
MSTRTARRRLWLLGGSALAALAVVAVLVVVSQSGGGSDTTNKPQTTHLFDGIPQHGATLGDPNAPVKMVEFVDLQCPYCAEYTRNVLPTLVKRYVRQGELSIELRPLVFIGPDSETAARAAATASQRNRMWQFADLFYLNQGQENSGYVTPDFLRRITRGAGLDPGPVLAAGQSSSTPAIVTQAEREASRRGIDSTPSFLLGRRGGSLSPLEVSQLQPGEFTNRIDALLNG